MPKIFDGYSRIISILLVVLIVTSGCSATSFGHFEYIELRPISPDTLEKISNAKQDYCNARLGRVQNVTSPTFLGRAYDEAFDINIGAIGLRDFTFYELYNRPADSLPAAHCLNLSGRAVWGNRRGAVE